MKAHKGKPKGICPIASAASRVGDMWTILITRDLLDAPKRFSELQRSIVSAVSDKGINSRTLTNRLKALEQDDIVKRSVFPHEMPPRVEYSLTKKGHALSALIEQIRKFGMRYMTA